MLNAQWKELCLKNIEIQSACSDLQNAIDQIKEEAKQLYDSPFSYLILVHACNYRLINLLSQWVRFGCKNGKLDCNDDRLRYVTKFPKFLFNMSDQ